jgi:hypothetical protein
MKHLKNYQTFVNEGVYLNSSGQAVLSWQNDKDNPDEVLKSVNTKYTNAGTKYTKGIEFSRDTPISYRKETNLGWPTFYSLSVDDYTNRVDDPARFKYTMDQLKDANIKDIETELPDFIKQSFQHLGITRNFNPDYIVSVGSTKGLVGHLVRAINQLIPSADPINLNKVKYLNAGDAINWDELKNQTERQESGVSTLNNFKTTILSYADQVDPEFKRLIKDANNADELRRLIMASGRYVSPETEIKWKELINDETMVPFTVRTSGRNFGGFKAFFKKKYAYDEQEFIDAVITCATLGKRMLIIDDNKNSGDDIKDIKKNILDILQGLETSSQTIHNLFGFYVLYKMKPESNWTYRNKKGETFKSNSISSSKSELDKFKRSQRFTDTQ